MIAHALAVKPALPTPPVINASIQVSDQNEYVLLLEKRLTPAVNENIDAFQRVLLADKTDMRVEQAHGYRRKAIRHRHTGIV